MDQYKEYVIEKGKGTTSGLLFLKREGQGPVPKSLSGGYTSTNAIIRAVEAHERSLKPRKTVKSNG